MNHIGRYGAGEDIKLFIIAIAILIIAYMFTTDANVACLGLVLSAACFGLFALTNSDWMIYGGNTLI
jgi:CBS-domain-containing membrane protein